MTTKETTGFDILGEAPICARCGSEHVVTDAWACWNREAGFWELETHFDQAYCRTCEDETDLQWIKPEGPENGRVRDLNDAFRRLGQGRGSVFVTNGVSALGPEFVARALAAVRCFNNFSEENDPWGEHDFGAFELEGHKLFWKIDPFDLALQAHSPNPANAALTHRVLTLMLASEY
ncbi:DUF3768 domain-containing protein [Marimonas sp. MJW-29]|uniref:DUF3768 domain-containing protein n=1 Tax=Sulfitobacter sediminis TaxID=3234186 RepID=A0ABV3RRF3_9RHOB